MAQGAAELNWLDWLNFGGTVATIIGLALTLKVLRDVRRLQTHYIFLGRVPELLNTLSTQASTISRLLSGLPESRDEIAHELAQCQANLKSLRTKVPGIQQRSVDELSAQIRRTLEIRPLEREAVWRVYTGLSALGVEIRNVLADRSWEA
jgi:hypothetical protein